MIVKKKTKDSQACPKGKVACRRDSKFDQNHSTVEMIGVFEMLTSELLVVIATTLDYI